MTRLFQIPQPRGEDHDTQADPEEDEEASEVPVLALGVEVRDSRDIVDGVEQSMLRLSSRSLLALERDWTEGGASWGIGVERPLRPECQRLHAGYYM